MNALNKMRFLYMIRKDRNSFLKQIIINEQKLLKSNSYKQIIEFIITIDDEKTLFYIKDFALLFGDKEIFEYAMLSITNLDQLYKIKLLCNLLLYNRNSNPDYLKFIIDKFIENKNNSLRLNCLDIIFRMESFRKCHYNQITDDLLEDFCLIDSSKIEIIGSLFDYNKELDYFDGNFPLYKEILSLSTLEDVSQMQAIAKFITNEIDRDCYFMIFSEMFADLKKITDFNKLNIMFNILQDNRLRKSRYRFYIISKLFKIKESEKLEIVGKIVLNGILAESAKYEKIIDRIFNIEDKVVLENILQLISFISDKNQCYCLERIDFDNPDFLTVVNLVSYTLDLFKEHNIALNYQDILDVIYNKVLLQSSFDSIIRSLQYLLKQVKSNVENKVIDKNTKIVVEQIENKINSEKGRQKTKH